MGTSNLSRVLEYRAHDNRVQGVGRSSCKVEAHAGGVGGSWRRESQVFGRKCANEGKVKKEQQKVPARRLNTGIQKEDSCWPSASLSSSFRFFSNQHLTASK